MREALRTTYTVEVRDHAKLSTSQAIYDGGVDALEGLESYLWRESTQESLREQDSTHRGSSAARGLYG